MNDDSSCSAVLVWMWPQILETLRFLHVGAQSNFWGLACPFYCTSPSIGTLIAFGLAGLILGFALGIWTAYTLYFWIFGQALSFNRIRATCGRELRIGPAPQGVDVCRATCMGEPDREVWDLTLQLEGLSLRLSRTRGHLLFLLPSLLIPQQGLPHLQVPAPVAAFAFDSASRPFPPATGSSPCSGSPSAPQVGPSDSVPVARQPCPATGLSPLVGSPSSPPVGTQSFATSASAVPEYPLPGQRDLNFEQRQRLALSFPAVPDTCLALCRALQATELSAQERAARAWTAGLWAGAVLRGEVLRPDPSPTFNQPSRYYCVLRASGLPAPIVCASLGAYRKAVGVDVSKAVSHSI